MFEDPGPTTGRELSGQEGVSPKRFPPSAIIRHSNERLAAHNLGLEDCS